MPIKYVPFIPEPIEGQAVLGNFNRILKYKGADGTSMVLQRGMPLYEMEKQETVGENADGNMVIRGECVSACAYLKEHGIQLRSDLHRPALCQRGGLRKKGLHPPQSQGGGGHCSGGAGTGHRRTESL